MDIYRTAMGHEAAFFETSAEKNRDPTETTKMTPCAATSISLDLSFILISLGWLVCQLLGN